MPPYCLLSFWKTIFFVLKNKENIKNKFGFHFFFVMKNTKNIKSAEFR